jgi:hypothetical protein
MKFYFLPYHLVKDKIHSIIEANKKDFEKNYGPVDVDYEHFETLSALGMAYVALAVQDDVAGFAGFVINHNTTHKEIEAENVVFYIGKKHRGQFFSKLLDYSKKEFQKMGVPKITVTIKSRAMARALKMNDFTKQYETWELVCG